MDANRRYPLAYNQQGNPLQSNPNLDHGVTNQSGRLPGTPTIARGVEWWTQEASSDFILSDGNRVWLWESPVFDLRPAASAAYGQSQPGTPINHEGALGQAIYLFCAISSRDGTFPISLRSDLRVEYWEDGSGITAEQTRLLRLTRDIDITETVLAGGTSTVQPFGASPISLSPCVSGLRFWKVSIRVTITGAPAITTPYFMQASLH